MKPQHILPVLIFIGLAAALYVGLFLNPRETAFALKDKPVPQFKLPTVTEGGLGLQTVDLTSGEVSVVNFFATWCAPCRAEHPLLMQLADQGVVMHGINYKDKMAAARLYLQASGDPFIRTGFDESGRTGIDWGLAGVPETFVIDKQGNVVWRVQGPLNDAIIRNQLMPLLEELDS
ncbi:MAG: DsbE family thiol:disulfide interchange protein [Alphaproteobacteria bacterium]